MDTFKTYKIELVQQLTEMQSRTFGQRHVRSHTP